MDLDSSIYAPLPEASVPSGPSDWVTPITSPSVIFKYNPHRMPPDDVMQTFVGRDELLSQTITHLRAQRGAAEPKHVFFHGPRGIGKTTMLLVLRYTIDASPGLKSAFDVVQFSEEERRVANLPAFAVRVLEYLCEVRPETEADVKKAQTEPERAFEILLDAGSRMPDRQILLLLDNFDELAGAVTSGKSRRFDAKKLKPLDALKRLLTSPHFVVVGTALQSPKKRKSFPAELLPHFESIIEMRPLPDPMAFLKKRAQKDPRQGFLDRLPQLAARIEGLNRLADGNPRLLVFLYDCLGSAPLLDLVQIVQRTVDDLTPMYQDVIDRLLNPGQAAVLEMLAENGGVGRAKDIAESTFQEVETVRTSLAELCNLGLAARPDAWELPGQHAPDTSRGTVYRTYPPLFQIWYEMRHLHREEGLYLVRFFSLLTEPEEVRRAFEDLRQTGRPPGHEAMLDLMSDIVDLLDPEWQGIRDEYVDKTLAEGGNLRDALGLLDQALADQNASQQRKTGLLVVRSGVRGSLGDWTGADADLQAAEDGLPRGAAPQTRLRLSIARSRRLDDAGEFQAALLEAQSALDLCAALPESRSGELRASALLAQASAQHNIGDYGGALTCAQHAEQLLRETASCRMKARAACMTGRINCAKGEYGLAVEAYQKALTLYQETHDRLGEAACLNNLGAICQSRGEYGRAMTYHESSLATRRDVGDRVGEAASLNNLGGAAQSMGRYDSALDYHKKAIAIRQQAGDRRGETDSLTNLGNVCLAMGDHSRAQAYYEESLAIRQEIGDPSGEAASLGNLGIVYGSTGDHQRAMDYFHKSLGIQQEIGDRAGEAKSLGNLGTVYRLMTDYRHALACHEKCLAIERQIGDRAGEAASLGNLGIMFANAGDHEQAQRYFIESKDIEQEIGNRAGEARSWSALGQLERAQGRLDEALQHLRTAHQMFVALRERPQIRQSAGEVVRSLFQLAALALTSGDTPRAQRMIEEALSLVRHAGPQHVVAAFVDDLMTPCLRHSRNLSRHLLPWVERLREREEFGEAAPALQPIEAGLRLYSQGQSALRGLGPAEMVLVQSLVDRVERPEHVEARKLLETGQTATARQVLEGILEKSPQDAEALFNLASVLLTENRLDEAEDRARAVLTQQAGFSPALQILAEVELRRGRADRAIAILRDLVKTAPHDVDTRNRLARILRAEKRFADLATALREWRDATSNRAERERLDVWIPEAHVLAGDLARAKAAMPSESFVPKEPRPRLLLGILRTFLALHEKNGDAARAHAAAALTFAAELPPGQTLKLIDADLASRAKELLGERESNFLIGLGLAIGQAVDPVEFANEFLTEKEVKEFGEQVAEEGRLAVEALRAGKVQSFRDLFRTSTRGIGPAAGLSALGNAYGDLAPGQRAVILDVLLQALQAGQPAELAAALGAIGQNFPNLGPTQRTGSLEAMTAVVSQPDALGPSREQTVRVLNVLYPNLVEADRTTVREALEKVHNEIDSPALDELFNETIPQVESEPKP